MKNTVLFFGVLLILITSVVCNTLICREPNFDMKNSCTIDGYTSKLETTDNFVLDAIYETAKIFKLVFRNSKVINIPNGIFTNLENLEKLDLSNSHVTKMSQETFTFAFNLRELNLSHNVLTELNDSVFDSADYLEEIDLSYNQIQTIDDIVFKNCNNLKKLDLSHNLIKIESSRIFPAYLTVLNLDFNKITKFSIIGLTNIEQITINNNELVFIKINAYLKSLQADNNRLESRNLYFNNSNLDSLSLKNNLLVDFNFINNMSTLSYLDLSHNKKTLSSNVFTKLTNLKTLILKSTNLSQSDIKLFSELRNLETFDISSNNLNYIDFTLISRLENLKYLNVHNNNLNKLTFNEFDYLFPKLNAIDISANNWICADLITVLTKLQKLKINIVRESTNLFNAAGPNIRGIQCTNITKIMLKYEPDLNLMHNNTELNEILNGFKIDNVSLKTKLNDILQKLNDSVMSDNVIVVNVTKNDYEDEFIEKELQNVQKAVIGKIESSFIELYDIKVYLMAGIQILAMLLFSGLLFLIYIKCKGQRKDLYNNYNFPTIECSKSKDQLLMNVP